MQIKATGSAIQSHDCTHTVTLAPITKATPAVIRLLQLYEIPRAGSEHARSVSRPDCGIVAKGENDTKSDFLRPHSCPSFIWVCFPFLFTRWYGVYGILEFNVPLDTVQVISETGSSLEPF